MITADGKHHTFSQFGSGTLVPGVGTYLSQFMVIDPLSMRNEEAHLQELGVTDAYKRLYIDKNAPITTTLHKMLNRTRENSRKVGRHGSCGMGIGEVKSDLLFGRTVFYAGDLQHPAVMKDKLNEISEVKRNQMLEFDSGPYSYWQWTAADILKRDLAVYTEMGKTLNIVDESWFKEKLCTGYRHDDTFVFEGAQGVLLDEKYGFHPYCSWSDTTVANAVKLLGPYADSADYIGIIRGYLTRHGPGPFPTESWGMATMLKDAHNTTNEWQGRFRVGHLDMLLLDYALRAAGKINRLVVTHLDRIESLIGTAKICLSYEEADIPLPLVGRAITDAMMRAEPVAWATFDISATTFREHYLSFISRMTGIKAEEFVPPWIPNKGGA